MIQLIIYDDNLSEDKLHDLTRDLCQAINKETDIEAEILQGEAEPGSRGRRITVGVLVLSFLTGGSAVALCDVLKTYVMRNDSLVIEITRGKNTVKINSQNIESKQVEQLLKSIKPLTDPEPHD